MHEHPETIFGQEDAEFEENRERLQRELDQQESEPYSDIWDRH